MHTLSRRFTLVLLVAIVTPAATRALAFPALQAAFYKEYLGDGANEDFVKLVKTQAKCNLCHQGKKSRKNRNAYGVHLAELIDMKKDAKNAEKLTEALRTVAKLHSVADDDASPTYGDLIAAGKLPAGDLDKALEEPAK